MVITLKLFRSIVLKIKLVLGMLFYSIGILHGQNPMTCLITIEQGITNADALEFWLEKDTVKSQYFKWDQFSKYRINDYYPNTNLFAYTDNEVEYGYYQLHIQLATTDTFFTYQSSIDLGRDYSGASIICHIGKSESGRTYLKEVKITRECAQHNDFVKLRMVGKPKLNHSPIFEIVCDTSMKIFPYNHYGHFYGNVSQKIEDDWETFCYVLPYQNFDCQPEYKVQPKRSILCYVSTTQDCSRIKINSHGVYKYSIDIATEEIEIPIPVEFTKSGTLWVRNFDSYRLTCEFEL